MKTKYLFFKYCLLLIFVTLAMNPSYVNADFTNKTQGDFNLSNRFSVEIYGVIVAGVHTIRHRYELESTTGVAQTYEITHLFPPDKCSWVGGWWVDFFVFS
jgi:hypothetical protein